MSIFRKVQLKDQYGWTGDATPNSEIITTDKIRLVGAIFNGATLDANFWTKAESTGTVTQANSELILTSGTANGHYARVYSARRANWVTGTSNKWRTQMRIASSDNDITLKMGVGFGGTMPAITDGAYFKIVGSTISVNTIATGGAEIPVASGNFNGTYTAPTLTNNNTFEILYTLGKVYFLINNVIVHTATFATTHWLSASTNLHAYADVTNTGDSSAVVYTFRMMNISRLGNMATMPTYKNITGVSSSQILKYGGGFLHEIIVGTPVNNGTINIYDNVTGTSNKITLLTLPAQSTPLAIDYNCPFFTGLNIVPSSASFDITVVYE